LKDRNDILNVPIRVKDHEKASRKALMTLIGEGHRCRLNTKVIKDYAQQRPLAACLVELHNNTDWNTCWGSLETVLANEALHELASTSTQQAYANS
jgi:hypothetical protein